MSKQAHTPQFASMAEERRAVRAERDSLRETVRELRSAAIMALDILMVARPDDISVPALRSALANAEKP